MSHSENKPKTSQASTVNTTNLNVQDTEGVTVVGDGNAITSTDYGAIAAAGEVGLEALELGRSSLNVGADLAGRGLDNAFAFGGDTVKEAFDFGTRSLDSLAGFADSALTSNTNATRDAFDFAGGAFDFVGDLTGRALDSTGVSARDAFGFAGRALDSTAGVTRDAFDFADNSLNAVTSFAQSAGAGVLDFAKGLVGDSVSGFRDLSMQTSASTDDRVAKVALYAFAAVAAAIVLPALFKD